MCYLPGSPSKGYCLLLGRGGRGGEMEATGESMKTLWGGGGLAQRVPEQEVRPPQGSTWASPPPTCGKQADQDACSGTRLHLEDSPPRLLPAPAETFSWK